MSELAHDAVFSNLEITKNIVHNGKIILDLENSVLNIDSIITSNVSGVDIDGIRSINAGSFLPHFELDSSINTFRDDEKEEISKLKGDRNLQQSKSLAIGGELNESVGIYASSLGGQYNESAGPLSATIGGSENKAYGKCSVAMGKNSMCNHDNSFIFNASEDELETTLDKQFMIGSDNGIMFKLPKSNCIQTHHIPEGFACWCWDDTHKTTVLKTRQNNVMYKTIVPTEKNELLLSLDINDTVTASLINPDFL